jgi:hypothetical protein
MSETRDIAQPPPPPAPAEGAAPGANPADAPQRVRRRGLVLGAVCGMVLLISVLLPAAPQGLPLCIFRSNTGIPCPTCGMTRGFIHMGHGRPAQAFRLNILAPALYALTIVIFCAAAAQAATARDIIRPAWARVRRVAVPLIVLLMMGSWAVNIIRHYGY